MSFLTVWRALFHGARMTKPLRWDCAASGVNLTDECTKAAYLARLSVEYRDACEGVSELYESRVRAIADYVISTRAQERVQA